MHTNDFEIVVCKMVANLSPAQCALKSISQAVNVQSPKPEIVLRIYQSTAYSRAM